MKTSRAILGALTKVVAVAMILAVSGGHWAILQSVAWAKMIVEYSRSAPLEVALEQTFDGQHPCEMCKMIQQAKQPTHRQELKQSAPKDDLVFLEARAHPSSDPPWAWKPGSEACSWPMRRDPPPVPPPRRFAARG
jgi:hypothetical protein